MAYVQHGQIVSGHCVSWRYFKSYLHQLLSFCTRLKGFRADRCDFNTSCKKCCETTMQHTILMLLRPIYDATCLSHAGGWHSPAAICYLEMLLFFTALVLPGLKLNTQMRGQDCQRLSKLPKRATSLTSCRWQVLLC